MRRLIAEDEVEQLFQRQVRDWSTARHNFEALKDVKVRSSKIGNANFKVQFNPARIVSSSAQVDKASIAQRECFLCEEHRPAEQEGIKWHDYTIIVNPFPIFRRHLTIPTNTHTAQRIISRIGDMMQLAFELKDYTLFYNGPRCGASAPDHAHFQAGQRGFMPYETDLLENAEIQDVKEIAGARLSVARGLGRVSMVIRSTEIEAGEQLFKELYSHLPIPEGHDEPMLNVLCWWNEMEGWTVAVFPRRKHRPDCYYAEGDSRILLSPASVDMGGVLITPLEEDFSKISSGDIIKILNEVCLTDEATARIVKEFR